MANLHRPTYTRRAALKFLPYFETLLNQLANNKPEGLFLPSDEFGLSVQTLQVRWSDALLWLSKNNLDDKVDRKRDFEYLKSCIKNRREEGGLRVLVYAGPRAESTVRETAKIQSVSDWKEKVEAFLADDERTIGMFENIKLTSEELDWVKRVTINIAGENSSVQVSGDRLVICK